MAIDPKTLPPGAETLMGKAGRRKISRAEARTIALAAMDLTDRLLREDQDRDAARLELIHRRISMPAKSKVAKCVKEVKKKGGPYNPYAVCQASTGEAYRTGKPPKGAKGRAKKKGK